jgi:hypothetical protein
MNIGLLSILGGVAIGVGFLFLKRFRDKGATGARIDRGLRNYVKRAHYVAEY